MIIERPYTILYIATMRHEYKYKHDIHNILRCFIKLLFQTKYFIFKLYNIIILFRKLEKN